jgi:hypothetical protein
VRPALAAAPIATYKSLRLVGRWHGGDGRASGGAGGPGRTSPWTASYNECGNAPAAPQRRSCTPQRVNAAESDAPATRARRTPETRTPVPLAPRRRF